MLEFLFLGIDSKGNTVARKTGFCKQSEVATLQNDFFTAAKLAGGVRCVFDFALPCSTARERLAKTRAIHRFIKSSK